MAPGIHTHHFFFFNLTLDPLPSLLTPRITSDNAKPASSREQLETNLVELEKGPLPEEVVHSLDDRWMQVRAGVFKYWH